MPAWVINDALERIKSDALEMIKSNEAMKTAEEIGKIGDIETLKQKLMVPCAHLQQIVTLGGCECYKSLHQARRRKVDLSQPLWR